MRNGLCRILLALLIAAGVIVVPASSASACSCAVLSPREYLRHSDAVFTGRLMSTGTSSVSVNGVPLRVLNFRVGRVFKGAVTSVEEVVTAYDSATCGLDLRGHGPFLVFASGGNARPGEPRYSSSLCSGTREISDSHPVPAVLGTAAPPVSRPSEPTARPTAGPTAEPAAAGVAATPEVGDSPWTAPELRSLALLAVLGAVLAVLWRLRRPTGR